jgi:hypothetical protein
LYPFHWLKFSISHIRWPFLSNLSEGGGGGVDIFKWGRCSLIIQEFLMLQKIVQFLLLTISILWGKKVIKLLKKW